MYNEYKIYQYITLPFRLGEFWYLFRQYVFSNLKKDHVANWITKLESEDEGFSFFRSLKLVKDMELSAYLWTIPTLVTNMNIEQTMRIAYYKYRKNPKLYSANKILEIVENSPYCFIYTGNKYIYLKDNNILDDEIRKKCIVFPIIDNFLPIIEKYKVYINQLKEAKQGLLYDFSEYQILPFNTKENRKKISIDKYSLN